MSEIPDIKTLQCYLFLENTNSKKYIIVELLNYISINYYIYTDLINSNLSTFNKNGRIITIDKNSYNVNENITNFLKSIDCSELVTIDDIENLSNDMFSDFKKVYIDDFPNYYFRFIPIFSKFNDERHLILEYQENKIKRHYIHILCEEYDIISIDSYASCRVKKMESVEETFIRFFKKEQIDNHDLISWN